MTTNFFSMKVIGLKELNMVSNESYIHTDCDRSWKVDNV